MNGGFFGDGGDKFLKRELLYCIQNIIIERFVCIGNFCSLISICCFYVCESVYVNLCFFVIRVELNKERAGC